eukprot:2826802-Rhodomonas_salina.2
MTRNEACGMWWCTGVSPARILGTLHENTDHLSAHRARTHLRDNTFDKKRERERKRSTSERAGQGADISRGSILLRSSVRRARSTRTVTMDETLSWVLMRQTSSAMSKGLTM